MEGEASKNIAQRIQKKMVASFYHLLLSIAASAIAAFFIFIVWYPEEFGQISGGADLFHLIVLVEIAMGPLMTLVVYNSSKTRFDLIRDYLIIGVLQISALLYGVSTAYSARPVFLVFVKDRFEVVHAMEIKETAESPKVDGRPLYEYGPRLLSVEFPEDPDKLEKILFSAIDGRDIHLMPQYYSEYDPASVIPYLNKLDDLMEKAHLKTTAYKEVSMQLEKCQECRWAPLIEKSAIWTVILEPDSGRPIKYIQFDPF